MMRTRRSLFVFGALLAVGVLLAPQAAFAQPGSVTAVKADAVDGLPAVTVRWTENSDIAGVIAYEIAFVASATATEIASTVTAAVDNIAPGAGSRGREYTLNHTHGLQVNTTYLFGVRERKSGDRVAYTVAGEVANSRVATGPAIALEAPATFSVSTGGAVGEVNATWSVVSGATGYSIRSMPKDGKVWSVSQVTGGSTTTATISGLAAGPHDFQIATMNSAGTGAYSGSKSATPRSEPGVALGTPEITRSMPKRYWSIEVNWECRHRCHPVHGRVAQGVGDSLPVGYR